MKKISLPVVTRLQDNGDGGYTMYVYNNQEEMLADHPETEKWDIKLKKYVHVELSDELKEEILNEEDPYKNGYMGTDTIELILNDDGTVNLAKPLSFHGGQ